jgi:6-phosphofructokinase
MRAVEALLEGESGKMVGVSANSVVLRPLSEAWQCRTQFDPKMLRVAHALAT